MYYGTEKKDNHAQVYRYFSVIYSTAYCHLLRLPMLFVFIVLFFFKSDNKMLSKVFLYMYVKHFTMMSY